MSYATQADWKRIAEAERRATNGRRYDTLWMSAKDDFSKMRINGEKLLAAARLRDKWNPTWSHAVPVAERAIWLAEESPSIRAHGRIFDALYDIGRSMNEFGDALAKQWKERDAVMVGVESANADVAEAAKILTTIQWDTTQDVSAKVILKKAARHHLYEALKALGGQA